MLQSSSPVSRLLSSHSSVKAASCPNSAGISPMTSEGTARTDGKLDGTSSSRHRILVSLVDRSRLPQLDVDGRSICCVYAGSSPTHRDFPPDTRVGHTCEAHGQTQKSTPFERHSKTRNADDQYDTHTCFDPEMATPAQVD